MNTGTSRASAARKSGFICSMSRSRSHSGSVDSTSVAPSLSPRIALISAAAAVRDRHRRLFAGAHQHRLADDADAHAVERRGRRAAGVARVAALQHRRARHRRVGVARVVIAGLRVLQRVEHLGAIGDRAADDAAAVAIDVGADRAAVEAEHRLVRQDQRAGIVVGRAAGRGAGLLAEARHHEIGADRHGRSRGRAERGRARRVVGVGRVAGPACCADSRAPTAAPCPGWCRPPGSPARPLYSVLTALAKMIAPLLRSCSTSTWSRAGKSMS